MLTWVTPQHHVPRKYPRGLAQAGLNMAFQANLPFSSALAWHPPLFKLPFLRHFHRSLPPPAKWQSWDTKAGSADSREGQCWFYTTMLAQVFHLLPLAGCSALTPNDLGSFLHHLHYSKTIIPSCKEQLYYTGKEPTSWEPSTKFNIDKKMPWSHVQVTGTALCSFPQLFQLLRIQGMYFLFSLGKNKAFCEGVSTVQKFLPSKVNRTIHVHMRMFHNCITALLKHFVRKMTTLAHRP